MSLLFKKLFDWTWRGVLQSTRGARTSAPAIASHALSLKSSQLGKAFEAVLENDVKPTIGWLMEIEGISRLPPELARSILQGIGNWLDKYLTALEMYHQGILPINMFNREVQPIPYQVNHFALIFEPFFKGRPLLLLAMTWQVVKYASERIARYILNTLSSIVPPATHIYMILMSNLEDAFDPYVLLDFCKMIRDGKEGEVRQTLYVELSQILRTILGVKELPKNVEDVINSIVETVMTVLKFLTALVYGKLITASKMASNKTTRNIIETVLGKDLFNYCGEVIEMITRYEMRKVSTWGRGKVKPLSKRAVTAETEAGGEGGTGFESSRIPGAGLSEKF